MSCGIRCAGFWFQRALPGLNNLRRSVCMAAGSPKQQQVSLRHPTCIYKEACTLSAAVCAGCREVPPVRGPALDIPAFGGSRQEP